VSAEARIARVIQEFDAQGWHRTGTTIDAESAVWLVAELRASGLDAHTEGYSFERFVPGDAWIEVDGARIGGLPMFDAPPTGPRGVQGRLGDDIALVVGPPGGPFPELDEARKSSAKAVVYVTTAQSPGLAPRNAEAIRHPFGPPVLQVGSAHRETMESAKRAGGRVTVSIEAEREPTTVYNVVATVPGTDPELAPIGVMTPRSGWWNCASERGGGLACFLEVARATAAALPKRTVHFVASSGHELGHWGLEEYLLARPGLAKSAALWVHFGASVGAAVEPRPFLFASSRELAEGALAHLKASGAALPALAPDGAMPSGESREIAREGGAYVSFLGASGLFHLEEDRWPDAVDVPQIAAIARATSALVLKAAG